mgnify:CR=1 FL=1
MKKILAFNDPILDSVTKTIELPSLKKSEDIYLDLLETIISQQLSGNIAKIIFNRFLELFENGYPDAEILAQMKDEKLRSAGLSNAKAQYVKNLATFAISNDITIKHLDHLSDEEIIDLLTKVKGVGKWSVEMILIFSLQRPDIFPYDDLVIKKSMVDLYKIKKEGKELILKMNSIANKWRPNRTLASRYLWAHWGQMVQKKKG